MFVHAYAANRFMYFAVCECYILSIPSHVLVDVGSDANFTCQSSIVNGISWYFTRVEKSQNEKHRLYLDYVNKSASSVGFFVFNSADQRTSTLHLSEVKDHYSGTYTCADANDAAFADLTVVRMYCTFIQLISQCIAKHSCSGTNIAPFYSYNNFVKYHSHFIKFSELIPNKFYVMHILLLKCETGNLHKQNRALLMHGQFVFGVISVL